MGLLNKVGAAVGIGAAEVQVRLESAAFAWGDRITGALLVQGGNTDQTLADVKVSLREHWVTRDSDNDRDNDREHHYRHHGEVVLAREVSIPAGSRQETPFTITVPDGLDLGHDYAVSARLSVRGGADRTGLAEITLLPPAFVRGLATALRAVAPFTQKSLGHRKSESFNVDFAPPENLRESLDGVRFLIKDAGDNVTGEFEINPQEKSLSDRFRALLKKDRVRHPITFPKAALAQGAAGPAPDEIVTRLRELLTPYL